MGYRLEISEMKYKACGGKLYGYVDDEKKLKSHQWLLNHNYIDGDEYWSHGCNPKVILSPEEFKEFIKLYNEDCNDFKSDWIKRDKDSIINNKDIKELIDSREDKILEWW